MHPRRYYQVLRAVALLQGYTASASVCLGMRNAVSGTSFPLSFPERAALLAAGYACIEDLGNPAADPDPPDARAALREELARAGLRASAVAAVIATL